MDRRSCSRIAVAVVALALAGGAQAATLTVGEVIAAGIDDFGFTSTTAGGNVLSFSGPGGDEVWEMYGFLASRDTDNIVRVFNTGTGAGFSVVKSVDTAPTGYSDLSLSAAGATRLGGGLAAGDITMRYSYQLVDDVTPTDLDIFRWIVDVTNHSSATRNLTFYAYLDLDLRNSPGNDSAVLGTDGIHVSDGAMNVVWDVPNATRYQVGPYTGAGSVRTLLDNMLTSNNPGNLSNGGLPFGPGDFTAVYQVDFAIGPGQSIQLTSSVPEPDAGALIVVGLAGLAFWGRPRAVAARRTQASA
jgi:hypothetical protein